MRPPVKGKTYFVVCDALPDLEFQYQMVAKVIIDNTVWLIGIKRGIDDLHIYTAVMAFKQNDERQWISEDSDGSIWTIVGYAY